MTIRAILLSALLFPCEAQAAGPPDPDLALLGRVLAVIHDTYLHDVSRAALARAAIDGMLASLDPHSAYLTGPDAAARAAALAGERSGVGLDLAGEHGVPIVAATLAGSPAARAGLRPGDRILQVDGVPAAPMLPDRVQARIAGPAGTRVCLVVRTGSGRLRTLRLTRAALRWPVVRSATFGTAGYLRLVRFDADAAGEITAAWRAFPTPPRGLLLDLRGNGGGELDAAIAVARLFIRAGAIAALRGRDPASVLRYDATGQDITDGVPMVVLIDTGTASASEIVAGALQDHRRAAILGTRSWGKGTVQTTIPLDGAGALVLTTALVTTPGGQQIQGRGIVPDAIVHETRGEPDLAQAPEASLPRAIAPADATVALPPAPWRRAAATIPIRPPPTWPRHIPGDAATDFQLQEALALLGRMPTAVTVAH